MMMCSDCGGIIVFQGCNSMQKIFENIGNVGIGMQIFMIFYLSKTTVQNCNLAGCSHALLLETLIFNEL